MPRLTLPFGPDGLLVPALVGLAAPALQARHARGAALPAPVHARGMIDSGSTLTVVVSRVLAALGATPGPATQTQTAAGPVAVAFYDVSFTVYDPAAPGVVLSRVDWRVTSFAHDPDDVDILFGLDLLREIVLTVDGPGRAFSLDF